MGGAGACMLGSDSVPTPRCRGVSPAPEGPASSRWMPGRLLIPSGALKVDCGGGVGKL